MLEAIFLRDVKNTVGECRELKRNGCLFRIRLIWFGLGVPVQLRNPGKVPVLSANPLISQPKA